jgi:hypothetical protein
MERKQWVENRLLYELSNFKMEGKKLQATEDLAVEWLQELIQMYESDWNGEK